MRKVRRPLGGNGNSQTYEELLERVVSDEERLVSEGQEEGDDFAVTSNLSVPHMHENRFKVEYNDQPKRRK